ncbi:MAG: amino acid permease [Syntrophobacteraceae bacterium]|nr:amino acid permease [Syntrophobacteraceae bacterium]
MESGALFRKKSISDLMTEAHADVGFKRTLGPVNLVAIGVGGIIGAGIFVLTGQAAANYAGPGIVLSFILAGIACAFAGLCYAEFASMIPLAGSAYTYSYATIGELVAWFIGWDLILEYGVCAGTVAVGWSGYAVSFLRNLGITVPPQVMASPGTHLVYLSANVLQKLHLAVPQGWYDVSNYIKDLGAAGISIESLQQATSLFNLPGALIVLAITALLIRGIRESAVFNAIIVIIKVSILILVIGIGFAYVKTANWFPIVPPNTGEFGHFGWSGVARGAGVIFFAYIGFDAVSTAAQETVNPKRDMPIGILGSLIICTIMYILVALVITGVAPYSRLNVPDPIAVAIDIMGIRWLAVVVKLGAIAGLTSVILVFLMGQPRIFFTMSRDGLLPPVFAKVHPKYGTPFITTLATGFAVSFLAALVPLSVLGELVSIGTLAAFIVVCASVLVLHYKMPDVPRSFRTPWVPFVPLMGILFCLYLALGLSRDTWIRLVVWLAIGMIIYFKYGIKHSVLNGRRTAPAPNPGESTPIETSGLGS